MENRRLFGGRGRRGQNLVEFALIVPFMAIFVLIVIDFGRYIHTKQIVINLTRQTAHQGARGIDPPPTTAFPKTMQLALENASPINMTTDGKIFIGQLIWDKKGAWIIEQYQAGGGYNAYPAKILADGLGGAAKLPASFQNFPTNAPVVVVESYLKFTPILPFTEYFKLKKYVGLDERGVYDYAAF